MQLIGSQLVLVVPAGAVQNPMDTTRAHAEVPGRFPYHRRGWGVVVAGVIWLAVVIYALTLGTRLVRAVERFVEKYQGGAP